MLLWPVLRSRTFLLEPEKRLRLRAVIVRLRGSVVAKLRQFLNFKTNFNNFYNLKKNRYTNKKKYYFPFLKLYFLSLNVNTERMSTVLVYGLLSVKPFVWCSIEKRRKKAVWYVRYTKIIVWGLGSRAVLRIGIRSISVILPSYF